MEKTYRLNGIVRSENGCTWTAGDFTSKSLDFFVKSLREIYHDLKEENMLANFAYGTQVEEFNKLGHSAHIYLDSIYFPNSNIEIRGSFKPQTF